MTSLSFAQLADLRGLRTAPPLTPEQRFQFQEELRQRVAACDWCTIGIMAPAAEEALASLHQFQQALGWPRLEAVVPEEIGEIRGPVFLKGHQRTGQIRLRAEAGLGDGVLVSGHSDGDPEVEDTWGPLPLDLFGPDSTSRPGAGATGL